MKRILITGGCGFLGSHLCDKLLSEGNIVTAVDNFHTGQLRNVQHLLNHPNFSVIRHDITEPLWFEADEVYNLACPASPVHYQYDPIHTLKTSVWGSLNILEQAMRIGAKVFQASTSEVYGDPEVHPQVESYRGSVNTIGPRACYDEGKRCAETLFFDYHRRYNLKIKIVRIFNTYGPRMHPQDGRVVSNFIVQALKGEPITIYGDGSQTRSFCYYSDLIDGFLKLMNSDDSVTGPINIGNPIEYTMMDLAKEVLDIVGCNNNIIRKALPQDDPLQRKPDISAAKKILGWQPTVNLREGLEKTIKYFEEVIRKPNTQN